MSDAMYHEGIHSFLLQVQYSEVEMSIALVLNEGTLLGNTKTLYFDKQINKYGHGSTASSKNGSFKLTVNGFF